MLDKLLERFIDVICGDNGCIWTLDIFLFGLAVGATVICLV